MSNLTTLPKGDSAWLLRKSIQRIMQQVSVLETNIGSSTTGNSSNTQVIFNDNGTLRGDAGLTYNAATDTLTAGSATITGDLTVDTSTLKVDSANNRVGINTASPLYALDVRGAIAAGNGTIFGGLTFSSRAEIGALSNHDVGFIANSVTQYLIGVGGTHTWFNGGSTAMTLNATGLGIGVTPSAKLHVGDTSLYAPSLTWNAACASIVRSENGQLAMGSDNASPFSFWFQCRTLSNTSRDVSFNPLGGNFGIGTLSPSNGKLTITQSANADSVYLSGNSGNFLRIYGWSVDNTWNTNAAAILVGKQTSTSRSINAGGTVNASGADYAEYMTKAFDFVLSKGDVAGIDANGKLTNVFADAVSFVVKSTDPSYVGNDKWGVGLEGDALEAARQLVDRIAFAGQVPVNVIGAKSGDYIVPVVDGTGIKGIAVTSPTFEQYQIAVGKVIAIDADGRARIIVKVA